MILATIGKDQFTKDRIAEKFLQDSLGDRIDDPLSKQVVFANDTNIPSIAGFIMESCGSVSMFSPEQTVVVHKAETIKADEAKALARWLKDAPNCKLLLEFDELRATSELYKVLAKVAKVEKCDEPKSYKMPEWIASMVPSFFHKAIDRGACDYLSDALGTDTRLVAEEVEKVLLYKPDCTKLTEELVKSLVVPQRPIPPYEICDSFGKRDANNYARILHNILYGGGEAISLTNSLYNYAMDLLNFKSLTQKGMGAEEACQKIGKNYFIFCKRGEAAKCCALWPTPVLCRVIRRLADLNYEFKSSAWSVTSQELALAALVVR